jgi:squalene-associated FAD-dependent desaturase
MSGHVHVIGAGLSGLCAAVALTAAGRPVTVYEAGPAAGGRCRSYMDKELGIRVDNGNHLLLSGNTDAMAFVDQIGSRGSLGGPGRPIFPFMDLASGARWILRPNRGRFPSWIFRRSRRVPGTGPTDYLKLLSMPRIADDRVVAGVLPKGALYTRLVEPFAVSALNTRPEEGLARLLGAVIRESLMKGGNACIPLWPRRGWSETLIDPAIGWLEMHGAQIRLGQRIAMLDISGDTVTALRAPSGFITVGPDDDVVLAVPPWVASGLLPNLNLTVPDAFEAIVNVHYRTDTETEVTAMAATGGAGFIGLIGGTAQWVFVKPGHVSVTISAAGALADRPSDELAEAIWPDVRDALRLVEPMPQSRVVKEKRATFAATAEQDRRRPMARIGLSNLVLAGDWTATGLPATIEGAIRSGRTAVQQLRTTW